MITIKAKLTTDQSQNSLGREVGERAEARLIELRYLSSVKEKLKDLNCTNSDHADFDNLVEIDKDGQVYVDICCPILKATIEDILNNT